MSTSDAIELRLSVERDSRPDTNATMRDLRSFEAKWGARSGLPINSTLARYQVTFAVIVVSSALFYALSKLNDGFTVASGCLQLVLVHGPTAVFFLVACFWGDVESEIRCSARGLDGASISGSRHRPIALAMGCSVLVKLFVIISTGTVTVEPMTEDRLMVKGAPILIMWLIIGLLVWMIGWLRSSSSEEHSTLGAMLDQSYLDLELSDEYHSNNASVEKSNFHEKSDGSQLPITNFTKGKHYWEASKPRLWPQLMLFAIPVVLIILLEHFYQCSRHHNGFKDIDTRNSFAAIIWRFTPPFLVLGISTFYDLWSFRVKAIQQHSQLELTSETLTVHPKDSWASLPHSGYISNAANTISTITVNLLLVVASGLFVIQNTDSGTPVSVIQNDTFDFSGAHLSDTNLDAGVVSLNSSNVQWTNGDMTLPSFTLPRDISTEENSLVTVTLPASRAKSNCKPLSPENVEFSHLPNNDGAYLNITAPPGCASNPYSIEVPYGHFGSSQVLEDNLSNTTQPECGRWLVSTGYMDAEDTSKSTATVLLCNPSAENVQAEVTFHAPSLQINRFNPPIVHEDTSTHTTFFLDHSETNSEGYIQDAINGMKSGRRVSPDYYADELFQAMVSETPPVEYVGEENMHRLLTKVQEGFGIRQTQYMNYHSRISLPEGKRPELNATMWNPSRLRIVQDAGSTYVLQGLLNKAPTAPTKQAPSEIPKPAPTAVVFDLGHSFPPEAHDVGSDVAVTVAVAVIVVVVVVVAVGFAVTVSIPVADDVEDESALITKDPIFIRNASLQQSVPFLLQHQCPSPLSGQGRTYVPEFWAKADD
ncbi:uncharacterized protein KD926_006911 [Aspergillus affinis]|uniref:uncharacterized protein n=1 Tax=Aspergillus affinis TaxID=1070780 RepID=UPI0022FE4132|nr:uncharacterized protein KD926_006911 [Aspergillus affinis]KAI9041335.1 hypothetical protein KD926_006911 [Aspergillus affinis]